MSDDQFIIAEHERKTNSNLQGRVVEGLDGRVGPVIDPGRLPDLHDSNIYLNESDLTKKIGVIRGHPLYIDTSTSPSKTTPQEVKAAVYTVGSNDGSCGITFETKDRNSTDTIERMIINPAGNVGIGTSTPNVRFEVQGDLRIDDRTIYLRIGNDPNHGLGWFGAGKLFANNNVDGPALFGFSGGVLGTTNGGQKGALFWNKDGNVGLGTATPNVRLEVKGDARIDDHNIYLRGGNDPNHGLGWFGAGKLFANSNVDGPALFGFSGGVLGTTNGGQKIALSWDKSGNVKVSGDIVLVGADCAEDFDIAGTEGVQPGTVMVIDNDGALRPSEKEYDKRVAGVISGAGNYRPGITLDKQSNKDNRLPIALTGKVYCKVDAEYSPIEVGDLLTTSPTIGHAMKVSDHIRSLGAIIGKALRPLESGCGLIPILVALQ